MKDGNDNANQSLVDKLIGVLVRLPWADVVGDALRTLRNAIQGHYPRGLYEVREIVSTLELKDREGKRAALKKRESVRYLQHDVIANQDQVWGDGEILLNYRCTPGTPADRCRSGHKTYILISRREVKDKRDVDEFNIEWGIRNGLRRQAEQWETHVTHRTKSIEISVVIPRSRPPRHTVLIGRNHQRSHDLGKRLQGLPDGRWRVWWATHQPRLYENYVLQCEW